MKISPNDPCPCGGGLKYKKCCRTFHQGTPAPTPETLMRSRYCAYALNKPDYIMQTTHPASPHWRASREIWRQELQAFSTGTQFVALAILGVDAETVTFRATLLENGRDVSFTERSLFRQEDGRWLYVQGL